MNKSYWASPCEVLQYIINNTVHHLRKKGEGRGGEARLKREWGLNNFLPLKGGGGTYLVGGGGLIEDLIMV